MEEIPYSGGKLWIQNTLAYIISLMRSLELQEKLSVLNMQHPLSSTVIVFHSISGEYSTLDTTFSSTFSVARSTRIGSNLFSMRMDITLKH